MSQNLHSPPKTNGWNLKNPAVEKEKSFGQTLSNLHFWSSTSSFFKGVSSKVKSQETRKPSKSEWFPRLGLNLGDFCFWGSKSPKETLGEPHKTCCFHVQRSLPFCAEEKKGIESFLCVGLEKSDEHRNLRWHEGKKQLFFWLMLGDEQ